MTISKKVAAMALGLVGALTAATLGQQSSPGNPRARMQSGDVIVVSDATIDWLEKSDVAALLEGVLFKLEVEVGDEVRAGATIGQLHDELATLKVARAKLAANNVAAIKKATAQKELAVAILARSERLSKRGAAFVSQEEIQKNEAEVNVAQALLIEAQENKEIAKSELDLAQQELEHHTIKAPFQGLITDRMRNEGERVGANEPVVRIVNTDKLRVVAWVPIEYAARIKRGTPVEVSPNIPNAVLPVEMKKFRGKITFIDAEAEASETGVRVHAEVENNEAHELLTGYKADMIIYLNGVPPAPAPKVGALPPSPRAR
ncbi:MAG TPA: efflux RND transporter periplasmic adaptor subunit [Isosphaeraceae bacterium]|nr:efflux RND transporter periplasmic adaptor subunit [Isosphaeraceae bacterium]